MKEKVRIRTGFSKHYPILLRRARRTETRLDALRVKDAHLCSSEAPCCVRRLCMPLITMLSYTVENFQILPKVVKYFWKLPYYRILLKTFEEPSKYWILPKATKIPLYATENLPKTAANNHSLGDRDEPNFNSIKCSDELISWIRTNCNQTNQSLGPKPTAIL